MRAIHPTGKPAGFLALNYNWRTSLGGVVDCVDVCLLIALIILSRSHSWSTASPPKNFFVNKKNSPHRTESVRARISHGDVRGRVQEAYHAGQALGSDRGPR